MMSGLKMKKRKKLKKTKSKLEEILMNTSSHESHLDIFYKYKINSQINKGD